MRLAHGVELAVEATDESLEDLRHVGIVDEFGDEHGAFVVGLLAGGGGGQDVGRRLAADVGGDRLDQSRAVDRLGEVLVAAGGQTRVRCRPTWRWPSTPGSACRSRGRGAVRVAS